MKRGCQEARYREEEKIPSGNKGESDGSRSPDLDSEPGSGLTGDTGGVEG